MSMKNRKSGGSRYRYALAGRDAHITTLRAIVVIMSILVIAMWFGWRSAPQHMTIYNPPDLRSGSTRAWDEVPPSTVYSFTYYIWQQLYRWPTDGSKDYKKNLYALQPYFTASCQSQLYRDYQKRLNGRELDNRVSAVQEIPGRGYREASSGPGSVKIQRPNAAWVVTLDLAITEEYQSTPVREIFRRFPVKVIKADVDPQRNPWGLQIDCLAAPSERIGTPDELPNQEAS
ncbi:PFL_4703 family integrating conjugative element protein [Carnimonas bestiolae]|uniref:PFL_4703 family integrating conjugative element protein n=1 Tax=Carnimonas bestiolae TaxID=3402172 RepID=UPI003EDC1354